MLHVICFGNPWQGDDGFGSHVFRRLRELPAPPCQVKLFDAGIASFSAVGYFDGCSKVVIVDALRTGGRAGSVHRLPLGDIDAPGPELSLHAFGVGHLLTALPVVFGSRALPEIVLIGAEIGEVRRFTDELTPPVQAAIESVVRMVLSEMMMHLPG